MTTSELLTISATLVATLFGLLCALLAWIGSKLHSKLDEVVIALQSVRTELHQRISETDRRHLDKNVDLDRRITIIEQRCNHEHGKK